MQTVLLVASIQAFFLVVLLLSKRERHLSDRVLAGWLGVIGAHTLIYYLFGQIPFRAPWLMNLNAAVPFLQGPFLYFYVDTLTAPRTRVPKSYAWHLLPAAAFVTYQLFVRNPAGAAAHGHQVYVHLFDISTLTNVALLVSVPAYAVVSLLLLRRFRRRARDTFSTLDRINLDWLRYLVGAMVGVWLVILAIFVAMKSTDRGTGFGHLLLAPVTLFVYVTGFLGFKQTTVFSSVLLTTAREAGRPETAPSAAPEPAAEPEPAGSKYRKSGLSEDRVLRTRDRLRDFMEREKPYLDDQLTLPQVASGLGVSVNHLAQVINEACGMNFHDFVNRYRVEEVQRMLQDPGNDAYSLLAVGLECGFGSKSSFNRIFKGVTGTTPSRYKREIDRHRSISPEAAE